VVWVSSVVPQGFTEGPERKRHAMEGPIRGRWSVAQSPVDALLASDWVGMGSGGLAWRLAVIALCNDPGRLGGF